MEIGDSVRIGGYVVVARALNRRGESELIVVHNESTHYALFRRDDVFQEDIEGALRPGTTGILLWSLDYGDSPQRSWEWVYFEALKQLLQEVTK